MLFVWIIILGLLQSAASLNINFLALLAVFAGFRKGPVWGLFTGVFIGAFAEILSSLAPGMNLILYSAVGLLSGVIKEKVYYREDMKTEFIFSFFGMLFFYGAYFAFARTVPAGMLFTIIFSSAISPLLFKIIE